MAIALPGTDRAPGGRPAAVTPSGRVESASRARPVRRFTAGLLALLGFLMFWAGVAPAEPRVLTLPEALAIAADNNRDIEKARWYIAWAEGRYVEERSAALPQLTVTASAGWDRDESQKIYGAMQTVRTGRRTVQLGLTQPLFTWGQLDAAIRAAKVGLQSAEEQLRVYRQAAGRDVSAAFYDVLFARDLHTLALHSIRQKERHLSEVRKKLQAGVATEYDLLAAEVSVKNARPEAIRAENRIRTARERLRFLLALEGGEVDVVGTLDSEPLPVRSYEEAFAVARDRRPDIADLRRRVDVQRELIALALAQDKPRVDLKGSWGWNQLQQPAASGEGASWMVGVQLSYPFFDGFRTMGRVTQAESDLRRLRAEEAKRIDAVALEVREALYAVSESGEIIGALAGTVGQAERLLAMAEKGYELGVKTRIEVEDAELNLRQARSGLSRANRDHLVARVNLQWVMGILGEEERWKR